MAVDDAEDDQLASMSTDDIVRAFRLLDNEVCVLNPFPLLSLINQACDWSMADKEEEGIGADAAPTVGLSLSGEFVFMSV